MILITQHYMQRWVSIFLEANNICDKHFFRGDIQYLVNALTLVESWKDIPALAIFHIEYRYRICLITWMVDHIEYV